MTFTASKAGSECDSVEVLPAKFDDSVIKLADLVDQFKISANDGGDDYKPKAPTNASSMMTRTSSTPALSQLRAHLMSEPVTHTLDFDGKFEDSTVVGIDLAADSKIEL